jgi:hypothetical protein
MRDQGILRRYFSSLLGAAEEQWQLADDGGSFPVVPTSTAMEQEQAFLQTRGPAVRSEGILHRRVDDGQGDDGDRCGSGAEEDLEGGAERPHLFGNRASSGIAAATASATRYLPRGRAIYGLSGISMIVVNKNLSKRCEY